MKSRIVDNKPYGKYADTFQKEHATEVINGQLVADWVLAPFYTENFIIPYWNGIKYIESATPAEIQLALVKKGKESIKNAYAIHRKTGFQYAQDFEDYLAEHVLIYKTISEAQALSIGHFLKDTLLIVTRGQWKSAKKEEETLKVTEAYMQPFVDKLINDVETYIKDNYQQ